MDICLINPPRISYTNPYASLYQPLGLASLAAVLEREHHVVVIDAPAEGWTNVKKIDKSKYRLGLEYDEIALRVKKLLPDIVGITIPFTLGSESAFEVAHLVKGVNRDTVVIVGGPHASVRPVECLKKGDIDFVVIGEGEHTILEVLTVLEEGKRDKLKNVRGIAYLEDGEPIITPHRPLIEKLDSLPFPARHLLPMDAYFLAAKKGSLRSSRMPASERWATVITSRGCPYNCVFCSVHIVMGRKYRARSPENVVGEIEQLVSQYNIKQIDFEDDNLTLDKRRMGRICDLIIEKGLDIKWYTPNGVRADALDEHLLVKMKKSGCEELYFSPETGVQRVMDEVIGKRLDLKKVEESIALCKNVGIEVNCYFIIGLIGETKEDIGKTIEYARKLKRLGVNHLAIAIARPYYGTELYEQAKQRGFLREDFNEQELGRMEPLIETPQFTARELYDLYIQAQIVNILMGGDKFRWSLIGRGIKQPRRIVSFIIQSAKYAFKTKLAKLFYSGRQKMGE